MKLKLIVVSIFSIACVVWGAKKNNILELVENGVPKAEIVIPVKATGAEKTAGLLLAKYISKSAGAEIPVVSEDKTTKASVKIYLGKTDMASEYGSKLAEMLSDGYIIDFPKPDTVVIAGAGDKGLDFAVFEFLERYVGVRWLWPGDLGEYVPENPNLSIPVKKLVDEPGFISRRISHPDLWGNWYGPGENDLQKWAYHMRYNSRVKFHHNLNRLFPPSKYAKSHPEFFPVWNGKRYIPPKDKMNNYQLCFTDADSVNEAIKIITNEFAGVKTNNYTYSLGINDIGDKGYCQCGTCRSKHRAGKNFLGFDNYSDLYYPWVNKIASTVSREYPTVRIGLLAYCNVIEPPENELVDPHVVPYLCYETLSFMDLKIKDRIKRLLNSWGKTKCHIGWYDYAYGRQYLLPRIYPRYLAKTYKYLYDNNVRYYYSEAYPDDKFMEGPKLYVIFKVLWNPNADADALVKEWCECAVGKEAAPYLVKYYDFYEDFWTKQIPKTSWFKGGAGNTYLTFKSNTYLTALRSNDLKILQQLLERVVKKADTGKAKARAEYILNSFLVRKAKIEKYQKMYIKLENPKVVTELENAGFDRKGQDKWKTWQRAGSNGNFIHSCTIGHTNPGSQMIDVAGAHNGPMCYMKHIPCLPDKIYRVSAWVFVQGLDEGADVSLTVRCKTSSKTIDYRAGIGNIYAAKWQKLEITFRCPVKEMIVLLLTTNSTSGKVFFDDVKVQEVIER